MSLNLWLDIDETLLSRSELIASLPKEADFQRWADATLRAAGRSEQSVSIDIRMVSEAESQALNRDYRGKDKSTNVLSFPADLPPELIAELEEIPLGDLAICADVVAREAEEQGKSLLAHWAHMTVHGVLHLLGHDHIEAADAACMEPLEIAILATLGWDNPYDDEPSDTPTLVTPRELP